MKNKKPQFKIGLLDYSKIEKRNTNNTCNQPYNKKIYISLAARSFAHVADS